MERIQLPSTNKYKYLVAVPFILTAIVLFILFLQVPRLNPVCLLTSFFLLFLNPYYLVYTILILLLSAAITAVITFIVKPTSKWIFFAYILLIVSFLAFCIFYFFHTKRNQTIFFEKISPAGQEYASWKIYRNNELGFELKYPSDWTYEENASTPFGLPGQNSAVTFFPADLSLSQCDHKTGIEFIKWNDKETIEGNLSSQTNRKKYNLDKGISLIKFDAFSSGQGFAGLLFTDKNIYEINVFSKSEYVTVFNKMFSTIRNSNCKEKCGQISPQEKSNCDNKDVIIKSNRANAASNEGLRKLMFDWYLKSKTYTGFLEDNGNQEKIGKLVDKLKKELNADIEYYVGTSTKSFVIRTKTKDNNVTFYCVDRFYHDSIPTGKNTAREKWEEVGNGTENLKDYDFHSNTNCLGQSLNDYTVEKPPTGEGGNFDSWYAYPLRQI